MRFFLTACVALAALISPVSQTECSAAFRFSNRTSKSIYVMYVRHTRDGESCSGAPWVKRGWWRLNPGQTRTVDNGRITNRYSYFYAESTDGTLKWKSERPVACVSNRAFRACWNDCSTLTRKVGLRKIDAGTRTSYTVNLTSSSSPRPTPPPPAIKTVQVKVWRHRTVGLTAAEADRILADMGGILQGKDAVEDVSTSIRFVRNGPVAVLPSHIPSAILSSSQLAALQNVGSGVKIVRAIHWCGGPGGSIIGCAPVPSRNVNIAAVRFTASQEGILWVHEYGHNVGLHHQPGRDNAIMFPSIAPHRKVVNRTESRMFLAGPQALTNEAAEAPIKPCGKVEKFVLQHYVRGIPQKAAESYTDKDAKKLLKMLADPDASIAKYIEVRGRTPETVSDYLPEIVSTLCYIGAESAVEPLIDFVKTPSKKESVFNARNAVLIHFGHLINKTENKEALNFLKSIASHPKKARPLIQSQLKASRVEAANAAVEKPVEADLTDELVGSAMLGLGLSGTDAAEAILQKMKSADAVDGEAVSANVRATAAAAAEVCDCVKRKGYYEPHEGHDHNQGHDHGAEANSAGGEGSVDIPATATNQAAEAEAGTENFVREVPARTQFQLSDDAGDALRTSETLPKGASDSGFNSNSDSGSSDEAATTTDNRSGL